MTRVRVAKCDGCGILTEHAIDENWTFYENTHYCPDCQEKNCIKMRHFDMTFHWTYRIQVQCDANVADELLLRRLLERQNTIQIDKMHLELVEEVTDEMDLPETLGEYLGDKDE